MQRNTKTFLSIAVIVILIAIGITYYFSTRNNETPVPVNQNPGGNGAVLPAETQTITAEHAFRNGTHIVAGTISVPTPCDSLGVTARIMESFPEQVVLDFKTTSSDDICVQVVSDRRFKIDFKSSENASIKATMNGNPANLKLVPASYDSLLSFDIFIKG